MAKQNPPQQPNPSPPKGTPPSSPPAVPSFVGTSLANLSPIYMITLGGLAFVTLVALDNARRVRQVERDVADMADLLSVSTEDVRAFVSRRRARA